MLENLMSVSNSGEVTTGSESVSAPSETIPSPSRERTRVRTYGSEHDILNAYYIFIHQYFPIFPPSPVPLAVDQPLDFSCKLPNCAVSQPPLSYLPRSPVSLAISAILALVPHPDDPDPSDAESVLLRRSYSQNFARLALEAVEADSELSESSAMPSQALQNERTIPNRFPIHPHAPVELEAILALLLLSVYEYAQRGNVVKMRNRAGQAFTMAMNLSLHSQGPEVDLFSEAKRRAWWMTFYCVCQGSIVSSTTPQVIYNDPRFVTPYPTFASDTQGWSILIQAQQVLLAATQFITDLNHTLRARGNMLHIYDRMKKLDTWIRVVMSQANMPPQNSQKAADDYTSEAITARSIRSISRIKLSSARIKTHRFRAFMDIPIFIKKHCDLSFTSIGCSKSENSPSSTDDQGFSTLSCCNHSNTASAHSPSVPWIPENAFPFSSFTSTTICLQSALTAAQMFDSLPYPQPSYRTDSLSGSDPGRLLPRTMPSFACCAMQSSYAMLMLYYRSRSMKQQVEDADQPIDPDELADELYHGLSCILTAVRNFSIAFEALGGMKEEIEGALLTAFPQST
ncbi:hypothetical protein VTO42DRAFT_3622 [Malbranchea cinnamomea]